MDGPSFSASNSSITKSVHPHHTKDMRNRARHQTNPSEIPISNPILSDKSFDKFPLLRNNTQIIKGQSEAKLKKSKLSQIFSIPENESLRVSRFFEMRLEEKLKSAKNLDKKTIISIHLEILEKIIAVDVFGPVLERIRSVLVEALNSDFTFKENIEEKSIKQFQKEIIDMKAYAAECEGVKKGLEGKLKRLSLENIELLRVNEKLEEENLLWRDFKKNIKLSDGIPDTLPLIKELKNRNSMIDAQDKRIKTLQSKEKKLSVVLKVLRMKKININEMIASTKDRRGSSDSLNISAMSNIDVDSSFYSQSNN
jgi:hypothetical protein